MLGLFLIEENNIELHRKEVYSEGADRSESISCHAHFGASDFQMLDYNTRGWFNPPTPHKIVCFKRYAEIENLATVPKRQSLMESQSSFCQVTSSRFQIVTRLIEPKTGISNEAVR